jgi:hypothetical protein
MLEKDFPLFKDLNDFLIEFNDTFGKIDKVQKVTTKFRLLRQGSHSASIYAIDFYQLAYDVDWNDNAFINAFWWRLQEDIKDLLLNLLDPLTLTEAIIQAVRCDN